MNLLKLVIILVVLLFGIGCNDEDIVVIAVPPITPPPIVQPDPPIIIQVPERFAEVTAEWRLDNFEGLVNPNNRNIYLSLPANGSVQMRLTYNIQSNNENRFDSLKLRIVQPRPIISFERNNQNRTDTILSNQRGFIETINLNIYCVSNFFSPTDIFETARIKLLAHDGDDWNVELKFNGHNRWSNELADSLIILVGNQQRIANDRISVILLDNVSDTLNNVAWWRSYIERYLRQALIASPDHIDIHRVNIGTLWDGNGNGYLDVENNIITEGCDFDMMTEQISINGGNRIRDIINEAGDTAAGNRSVVIVGNWGIYSGGNGLVAFAARGFAYIPATPISLQGNVIVHELLHTRPFGNMQHVYDGANLMYPRANNLPNILRHRPVRYYYDRSSIITSQWEHLQRRHNLFDLFRQQTIEARW